MEYCSGHVVCWVGNLAGLAVAGWQELGCYQSCWRSVFQAGELQDLVLAHSAGDWFETPLC